MSDDPWDAFQLSETETNDLWYGLSKATVYVRKNDIDNYYYTALWNNQPVTAPEPIGPWSYVLPDRTTTLIPEEDLETAYPGISQVTITNWHTLQGTFNKKEIHWSPSQQSFVYANNRKVELPSVESDDEEVSQLLESAAQSLTRTRSQLTPEPPSTSLPGAFVDTPDPVPVPAPQPVLSSSKGKTPASRSVPVNPQQQQTPPVSKAAPSKAPPTMSSSTTPAATTGRIRGSAPEPFDGSSSKAEAFWTLLASYYYLNRDLYPTESDRIAAALTHFKLGSTAGEWAKDLQKTALALTTPDFGTWDQFKAAFKAHFIPVDSTLMSTQAMHSLRMGNRPFSEWYQEWSTHASRSGANEETKMFCFRQNLPNALHQKILGVSPTPTTLTRLVELAKDFDQNWRMYNNSASTSSSRRDRRPNARSMNPEDPENPTISLADFPPRKEFKKLTQAEKDKRRAENRCLYCNAQGHWQDKCPVKPRNKNRFRSNRPAPPRTRALQPDEEPPEAPAQDFETPSVSRLYHDPDTLFTIPESDLPDPDF